MIKKKTIDQQKILQALTDNLPEMLWLNDLNGMYLFANKAICDHLLMARDISEPIGKTDDFFSIREQDRHPENKSWYTFSLHNSYSDKVIIQENHPVCYEECGYIRGKLRYFEIHKAPFYNDNGEVQGVVGSARDITEATLLKKQLEKQSNGFKYKATHDGLTNLPNRQLFHDRLEHALHKSNRSDQMLALFFIDIDHFKHINDHYGHDVGDRVLKIVARRIRKVIRNSDTLARLGGDEFTILVEDVKNIHALRILANKILKAVNNSVVINNIPHKITISMGIGLSISSIDSEQMLKCADSAMYRAKQSGRNQFKFHMEQLAESDTRYMMAEV